MGNDDFSLERVPEEHRYSWFSVATQRFGQLSSFSQFLLGATLGFGMTFWDAVLAITLGAVVLEFATILVGIAGCREGLSTSVLARWTGFGLRGSALVGLLIAVSLMGWFGVQNAVFAQGLHRLVGVLPEWAWALVGGLGVSALVVWGIRFMAWAAYVTVPAFILLVAWSIMSELSRHDMGALLSSSPAGPPLSLAAGTTIVAGGFIVGAVMTPDMTRYNRTSADVVKQTLLGVTLGEYVIALTGVLLAHAARSADVAAAVASSSGLVGTVVLVAAILKVNDWNLYSSSLGVVNSADAILGRKVPRAAATLAVGACGSVLSAVGILDHFVEFLTILGVATPPIAGIMIAEYFVVKTWRADLERTRAVGRIPAAAPEWVPAALVCWAAGGLVGYHVDWGVPAVNSIAVAFLLYTALGKAGLVRGSKGAPVGAAQPVQPTVHEGSQS
ncbi:cytosine permease [Streptomyces somaliensis]|uniref:purine-cytosine permease family protein n=1 Tax=Streptomyces somaliensis TaxID=78355 RepID=UPI0020CDF1EA|nr:cytosine permease [Streptomyces somaliensis]MCP9946901.1 cytosine permease [Streptomyces somaliensis]MCP9963540.1 cytosine permease [Streptomyces somaliensis]MCP9976194.1 cytosine permease [Streptomyces somaliensis]